MPSEVLDACKTRLRRDQGLVRPGVTGLLIGVECSRVRSIAWDRPYHIVTTRTEVELVDRWKLLDSHWEGLK